MTRARLTDDDVREILTWKRKRVNSWDLALHYGVPVASIRRINKGLTHRKVFLRWCAYTAIIELKEADA